MRKLNKKRKSLYFKLILILILLILSIFFINKKFMPVIYKKCRFEISKFAVNAINDAITEATEKYGYNYDDYVTIKTTEQGNVVAIFTNAKQITLMHDLIVQKVNEKLEKFEFQHVNIALGSFTGLFWLYSRGPHIPVKITSKGLTNSEIISDVKESGVNQTLHKLHIKIAAEVVGFLPFHTEQIIAESDCMLAESLIVGRVPKHYTKVVSGKNNDAANNAYKYDN